MMYEVQLLFSIDCHVFNKGQEVGMAYGVLQVALLALGEGGAEENTGTAGAHIDSPKCT
jgi:hypothetical protein